MYRLQTTMRKVYANREYAKYEDAVGGRSYELLVPVSDGWDADEIVVTIEALPANRAEEGEGA